MLPGAEPTAAPAAAAGATNKEKLEAAIKDLQQKFPGARITSTSGGQHTPGSAHYQDRAMDIGLAGVSDTQKKAIMDYLRSRGDFAKIDDESRRPGGRGGQYWSGPHIHAEMAKQNLPPDTRNRPMLAELSMDQVQAMQPNTNKTEVSQQTNNLMNQINNSLIGSKEVLSVLQDILNANRNQQDILGKILQNARS
jgi:hypothetical protein